jgi:hypothetical protein
MRLLLDLTPVTFRVALTAWPSKSLLGLFKQDEKSAGRKVWNYLAESQFHHEAK